MGLVTAQDAQGFEIQGSEFTGPGFGFRESGFRVCVDMQQCICIAVNMFAA